MSPPPPYQDARLDGGGLLILWGAIDPSTTDESDLNDWWTNEHLPERLRLPGFQRARRYRAIQAKDGQREYLACYEASNIQDFASPEYLHALDNPTAITKQFMPCLAAMHRCACRESPFAAFTSSNQTCSALILIVLHSMRPITEAVKSIQSGFEKHLIQMDCFRTNVQAQIAIQDETITKAGSTSRSYDGVQFTRERDSHQHQLTGKYIALFESNVSDLDKKYMNTIFANIHFHDFIKDIAVLDIQVGYRNAFELISSLAKSDVDLLTE